MSDRRLGLEQEFFVVEPAGEASQRADDLVRACRELGSQYGLSETNFTTEWVKNILEVNTPPAPTPEELATSYYQILNVALEAARQIGVRLYPYSVYPIHLIPVIRDEVNYHVQVRTVGHERFLNAGRCTGTHLHLEVGEGTIDPRVGVSYGSLPENRAELLNVYNLATALDPVLIALSRACPFYEGQSSGLAHRTARYRGNQDYGWEGVYTLLPEVGGLRPYAESIEHLVELQFERHYAWMKALDRAGVDRKLFLESGGNLLTSSWNPVRLNGHGTVELRNMDSNLPDIILGLMMLVYQLHNRLREDKLTVRPESGATTMQIRGGQLVVPDFETLQHRLLYAAVSEGIGSALVADYTQSVLELADIDRSHGGLEGLVPQLPHYRTTEARLLEKYYPEGESLTRETGLQLVRDACDEFEEHMRNLRQPLTPNLS